MELEEDPLWYKDAIIYELHVKTFFDSNGDGIGDFRGLISKLDYLQELGVNTLWLLPFFVLLRIRAGWILTYFVADAAIGIGFFRWQYLITSGAPSGTYDALSPQLVLIGVWGRAALLVALFIWLAENLATFARAWTYPHQAEGWQLVPLTKLGAWYLLMYISFVLVAAVHRPRGVTARRPAPGRPSAARR